MIDAVIARLEVQVPDLTGRVEGAADLEDLRRNNRLPQHTPAAHVLPLGLMPQGKPNSATGVFTQMFDEAVAVILTIRSDDATGARALTRLRELIMEIVTAIAGWTPAATVGVFRLVRAVLVAKVPGAVVYEIDFAIEDQLRIVT